MYCPPPSSHPPRKHPHRGFETITATIEGIIDHSDSHGNAGRYGGGDLQWMTAGAGVVHGEMFPLVEDEKPNKNRFFQIWLNLPKKDKFADPSFAMHWAEDVVRVTKPNGAKLTLFAGAYEDLQALPPCPQSWASDPHNDVGVYHITLPAGASIELPASTKSNCNRSLYAIEGGTYSIDGRTLDGKKLVELDASKSTTLSAPAAQDPSEMSVKELKQGIVKAGLAAQATGLSEKHEVRRAPSVRRYVRCSASYSPLSNN